MMALHPPLRPLIAAISRSEVERVPPLLEKGVDPNDTWLDGDRETALMVAAGLGFDEIVKRLLAVGADASARDAWGRTPCIWAAETHNVTLAEHLWQVQTGKRPSEVTRDDLTATRLDEIETPLNSPDEFLVLRVMRFDQRAPRMIRLLGLGTAADRKTALKQISDDNNHMITTGPYLLCRRIPLPEEAIERPTNPVAQSLVFDRIIPSQWLVLAHLSTATAPPGCSISRQHKPCFRGWATVSAVLTSSAEIEVKQAALAQPGRVSVVQLLEVCTCNEGWVESYEGMENTEAELKTTGEPRAVYPINRRTSDANVPLATPAGTDSPSPTSDVQRPASSPVVSADDFCIKRGFELFRQYYQNFISYSLIVYLLSIFLAIAMAFRDVPTWVSIPVSAVMLAPLYAGFLEVSLALAAKRPVQYGHFFNAFDRIVPLSGLALIVSALVLATRFFSPIGLVIPYVTVSAMYAVPLIIDRHMSLSSALEESWRITHRRFVQSTFQCIVIGLVALAGVALLGLGVLVTFPLAACVLTVAYNDMDITGR